MANQAVSSSSDASFLVKDVDGQFKVWQNGSLGAAAAAPAASAAPAITPNFTQPAQVPADIHFLPAPSSGQAAGAADFHFHPEDKEELAAEMNKITTFLASAAEKRKYSVEKIAAKLMEKNQLKFSAPQETQFVSLLLSYFRQARSYVITKESLIQHLSLDPAVADVIMVIVKNLKDKIELADGVVVRGATEQATIESAAIATVSGDKPEQAAVSAVISAAPAKVEVTPQPSAVRSPAESTAETTKALVDLPKVRRAVVIEPVKVSAPLRASRPAKVMSRIDELAAMTLEEFRQLDPDPRVRSAKILQRINNLAQESLSRKAQGIAAWRASQVYQTYLAMGHHGLEHGRNLGQITAELKEQGQPHLSPEEFEAMTDLNKQLRF